MATSYSRYRGASEEFSSLPHPSCTYKAPVSFFSSLSSSSPLSSSPSPSPVFIDLDSDCSRYHPSRANASNTFTSTLANSSLLDRLLLLSSTLPLTLHASLFFLFLAYLLCFSFRTHLILLCLYSSFACLLFSLYNHVLHIGLLSFFPPSIRDYFTRYSLLEISQMEWDSRAVKALISLFCFKLTPDEIVLIVEKLPKEMREMIMKKGIIHLLPKPVGKLCLPIEGESRGEGEEEGRGGEGGEEEKEKEKEEESELDDEKQDEEAAFVASVEQQISISRSLSNSSLSTLPSAPTSSSSSVSSPSLSLLSPPAVDEDPVSLFRLSDRALSSTFNLFFQHASEQFFKSAQDFFLTRLNVLVSPQMQLFVPLAGTIGMIHLIQSSEKVKGICMKGMKFGVDLLVATAAICSVYQLYSVFFRSYTLPHQRQSFVGEGKGMGSRSSSHQSLLQHRMSSFHHANSIRSAPLSHLQLVRLYMCYVWKKLRTEKSVWVSGFVLAVWMVYLSKGRQHVMKLTF